MKLVLCLIVEEFDYVRLFTAVSDNLRLAMSKMSLDFAFFCYVNLNLKAQCFLADLLGNSGLLQWVQKVMVCDLCLVDFDLFCVFLCFKVCKILKCF